jgi:hypothetical protein
MEVYCGIDLHASVPQLAMMSAGGEVGLSRQPHRI